FRRSAMFQLPVLTKARVYGAYGVAATTDALQLVLGPLGWTGADEALDVLAMALTWWLLGFHPLLLPTFVVEFLPIVYMVPTWTGCVALIAALRRRQQIGGPGTVIDVKP